MMRPRLIHQLLSMLLFALLPLAAEDTPPKAQPVDEGPVLKPGDGISMSVFGEAELSTNASIMQSGDVVFPLIGSVKMSGLTVRQATERVRELYAEKYLRDPNVRISVDDYAANLFSVIGAVNRAGQFPLPASGRFDLAAALAMAGGLSPAADRNRIVVTREDGRARTYSKNQAESDSSIRIEPGDRIIVHQSDLVGKTVTILGPVRRPGTHPIPLTGRFDIVTAIAAAGGFTPMANDKKVTINRKGQVTVLNVREMTEEGQRSYFLQPDDIVIVAERLF